MRRLSMITALGGLSLLVPMVDAAEQPKLIAGESYVETPAIGEALCVHNLFQSNMVIQRDKPIVVRGWAAPGEKISVSFGGQEGEARVASDRTWQVTLPAMKANAQAQKMVIQGKGKPITLENILIGDVWLLTGQSNMAHPLSQIDQGNLEIASANYPNLRLLTIPEENGSELKKSFPSRYRWRKNGHVREGYWDVTSGGSDSVRRFSGLGYAFVRRLHMATEIPIGAIDLSRGGTTVETWTPAAAVKQIDTPEIKVKLADWDKKIAEYDPQEELEERITTYHRRKKAGRKYPAHVKVPSNLRPGPIASMNRPGNCYASMMAPITEFAVKGVIWHQGYNNAFEGSFGARMYSQIFPKMISSWRTAFNDPQMPFCIISLCTEGSWQDLTNYTASTLNGGIGIREAQHKTFLDLYKPSDNSGDKSIGFVSSYDQRASWYHPQIKIPVAERAARWALATQYKMDFKWEPPIYKEKRAEGDKLILTFNKNLRSSDKGLAMLGFSIAGKDRVFHPAECNYAVIGKDTRNRPQYNKMMLELSSPHVPEPIHFRYAWGRNPLANIRGEGVPIATQRSDNWSDEDLYTQLIGKEPADPSGISRGEKNQLQRFLAQQDLKRRIKDAQVLLDSQNKPLKN